MYEAGERLLRYFCSSIEKSIGEHYAEKAQEFIETHRADEKMVVQSILSLVGKQFLVDIGGSDLHDISLASWEYYVNMGQDLNVEGYVICLLISSQQFLLIQKPNNFICIMHIVTICPYPRHMFHIVDRLMEDIPKGSLLQNKAVSKIKWDSSFTGEEGREYPVCVVCEDGDEILADHVIITISLGE